MSRSRLEQLRDYPYRKVAGVLGECKSDLPQFNLSIGEPKFGAYETVAEALAAADLSSLAKPIIEDVGVGSVEALRGYSFGALREALKREANVALNVPQIKKLKAFLS